MNNPEDIKNSEELPVRLAPEGAHQLAPEDLPPDMAVLAASPRVLFCGDIDMRIDGAGKWYYKGSLIERAKMVKLFSTILRRDDHGGYWLTTPVEMTRITVEDAPFMAVELIENKKNGVKVIAFRTNVDTIVTLDEDHPLRLGDGKPYITVRKRLEALLERSVYYQLVDTGEEMEINGKSILGVWSKGCFFPLGAIK